MQVTVFAADTDSPLARQVAAELQRARQPMRFAGPRGEAPGGPQVLLDDASLPAALRRLIQRLPGRLTFPTAVLCVAEPERAGATLADGYRDVVTPEEVPAAIDAMIAARPPLLLARLRRDVEQRFLPELRDSIRRRALEKHQLLSGCGDLLRAGRYLAKRIYRLEQMRDRQSLDDVYQLQGKIERFLDELVDQRRPRPGRMPRLSGVEARSTVLGRHEPRYPRVHDQIEETLAWLRDGGLLPALGKDAEGELFEAGERLQKKPLEALRSMLRIVEREVAQRVARYDRIEVSLDPLEALTRDCLERYGVGMLPPGIALPDHLRQVMRSGIEPPADVYLSFCLDLRDLRLKRCSEVMAAIGAGDGGAS